MIRSHRRLPRWMGIAAILFAILRGVPGVAFAENRSERASRADTRADTRTDTLTVDQCIRTARDRAPEVAVAAARLESARRDSASTAHNRRPSYRLLGDVTVAPHGFYDPAITNLGEYRAMIGAEWSVHDGGDRSRQRSLARLAAALGAENFLDVAREAERSAAFHALNVERYDQKRRIQSDALEWLDRLVGAVGSDVQAGVHTRADASRARLERFFVASDLVDTERQGRLARRELKALLGIQEDRSVTVAGSSSEAVEGPSAADSIEILARSRAIPSVRQAEIEVAQSRVAADEVRRRNSPRLSIEANAGLAGSDLTAIVPQDLRVSGRDATVADRLKRDLGASISIHLSHPLFGSTDAISMANGSREEAVRAAALHRDATLEAARRAARNLLERWRAAAEQRDLARSNVTLAEENLLRVRSLYGGGGAGILEVLDGRRQLDEARSRLADAEFEALLAAYEARIR